jgi:hypothetical protein
LYNPVGMLASKLLLDARAIRKGIEHQLFHGTGF